MKKISGAASCSPPTVGLQLGPCSAPSPHVFKTRLQRCEGVDTLDQLQQAATPTQENQDVPATSPDASRFQLQRRDGVDISDQLQHPATPTQEVIPTEPPVEMSTPVHQPRDCAPSQSQVAPSSSPDASRSQPQHCGDVDISDQLQRSATPTQEAPLLQAPGSTPPRRPTTRRKTLAGVTSFPGIQLQRKSPRIKAKQRTMPIARLAEKLLCQRLGIVNEGEEITEAAIAKFVEMFDGRLPDIAIAALRALFKMDCDFATAVEDALVMHGGAAAVDRAGDLVADQA